MKLSFCIIGMLFISFSYSQSNCNNSEKPEDETPITLTQLSNLILTPEFYDANHRYIDNLGTRGGIHSGGFLDTWLGETQIMFPYNNLPITVNLTNTEFVSDNSNYMYWMTMAMGQEYMNVDMQFMMGFGAKETFSGTPFAGPPFNTNLEGAYGPFEVELYTGLDRAISYPSFFPEYQTQLEAALDGTTSGINPLDLMNDYIGINPTMLDESPVVNAYMFSLINFFSIYNFYSYAEDLCWSKIIEAPADPYYGLGALAVAYNLGMFATDPVAITMNKFNFAATRDDPNARNLLPEGNSSYRIHITEVAEAIVQRAEDANADLSIPLWDYQIDWSTIERFFLGEGGTVNAQGAGGLLKHFEMNDLVVRQDIMTTLQAAFNILKGQAPSSTSTTISYRYDWLSLLRTVKQHFSNVAVFEEPLKGDAALRINAYTGTGGCCEDPETIDFDGVDDYVNLTSFIGDINTTSQMTWLRLNPSFNSLSTVMEQNNVKLWIGANRRLNGSVTTVNGTFTASASTVIAKDIWTHIAIVYDGTKLKLFINGEEEEEDIAASGNLIGASGDYEIGRSLSGTEYINAFIDDTRVYDMALSTSQLQEQVYQEIEVNGTGIRGLAIPKDIVGVPSSSLKLYYKMDPIELGRVIDQSSFGRDGTLNNITTIEEQNAPMPYVAYISGDWTDVGVWENGAVWDIANSVNKDWAIVHVVNNAKVTTVDSRTLLGLSINSGAELEVLNDQLLKNTNYVKLDGKLDLEGESQFIQTENSDLDATSSGVLERDQQGTQDLYTYNYWSSPVGVGNTITNNNSYTVPDVLKDGTNAANPVAINFITNGYDGALGTPISIADYWIWKYSNDATSYYNWQHIKSTGTLLAGEGFSMKGVNNTNNNVDLEQNYTFEGKPNNGDITLPITTGNVYLVGNPYASAIDAHQFILDNAPIIESTGATSGTLYFWEHWGGGSHITAEYQGGYATYNLSGAVPTATLGTNTLGSGGTPTKLPGRYIPVSQGFFVSGETTGDIIFNNGQRVFEKEGVNSVFMKNGINSNTLVEDTDERLKIRLGFHSMNTINRQLLVTVDPNASLGFDYGYDGEQTEAQMDDMYWMMNDKKYVIQGIDTIEDSTKLPLGVHTNISGINTFRIDELINAPSDLEVYIYDTITELYHDIKTNDFSINLEAGEYLDRFELRFSNEHVLSVNEIEANNEIEYYFVNENESIIIENPELELIESVELYNVLGQSVIKFNSVTTEYYTTLKTNALAAGNYVLEVKTKKGKFSKKVLIE
jgi:hypothetical protein